MRRHHYNRVSWCADDISLSLRWTAQPLSRESYFAIQVTASDSFSGSPFACPLGQAVYSLVSSYVNLVTRHFSGVLLIAVCNPPFYYLVHIDTWFRAVDTAWRCLARCSSSHIYAHLLSLFFNSRSLSRLRALFSSITYGHIIITLHTSVSISLVA